MTEKPPKQDVTKQLDDADKYEIEYVQERTGATTDQILIAMQKVGKNWVNIIFYLRNEKGNASNTSH